MCSPLPSHPSATQTTVHHAAVPLPFVATVVAEAEPLLLSRLLQRFACQGAELETLQYARRGDGTARIVIGLRAEPARARLLASRWRTLLAVRQVEITPAGAPLSPGT